MTGISKKTILKKETSRYTYIYLLNKEEKQKLVEASIGTVSVWAELPFAKMQKRSEGTVGPTFALTYGKVRLDMPSEQVQLSVEKAILACTRKIEASSEKVYVVLTNTPKAVTGMANTVAVPTRADLDAVMVRAIRGTKWWVTKVKSKASGTSGKP